MRKVGLAALTVAAAATAAGPVAAKIIDVRSAKSPLYELRCGDPAQPRLKVTDLRIVNMAPGIWTLRRDDGRTLYIETSQGICTLEEQR